MSQTSIKYASSINKGIVINIADFPGTVEIANSEFKNNIHFIPEILIIPFDSSLDRSSEIFKE